VPARPRSSAGGGDRLASPDRGGGRALPPGGEVPDDYVFEEGEDAHSVRMSQLFAGKPTLMAYSFMHGHNVATWNLAISVLP
jgi:predicted dithiol-disulfide oxidoreductase (DUF899 family)